MYVITFSGEARAGKTTMANALKEYIESQGKKAMVVQYGDYLKFLCKRDFGYNGVKDEKGREILQRVGTDIIRKNNPDMFVNVMIETMKGYHGLVDVFLVGDCRFPNEISKLKSCPEIDDVFSVKVERPGFDNGLTEEQKNHPSETALADWRFDLTVRNAATLEEYKAKAKYIWDYFIIKKIQKTIVI